MIVREIVRTVVVCGLDCGRTGVVCSVGNECWCVASVKQVHMACAVRGAVEAYVGVAVCFFNSAVAEERLDVRGANGVAAAEQGVERVVCNGSPSGAVG